MLLALLQRFVEFFRPLAEHIGQSAELFDGAFDAVAGLEESAGSHRDARWCASSYYIARLERHYVAQKRNNISYRINHLRCVGALADSAINGERHIEILDVANLVSSNKTGAHRQEAIGPFAIEPIVKLVPRTLTSIFGESNAAGRYVVGDCVAGYIVEGISRFDTFTPPADDNGELDFIIDLLAVGRPGDLLIGANDDGRRHQKWSGEGRLSRRFGQAERQASFFDVLAVVARECDDLGRVRDRCKKPDRIERSQNLG